MPEYARAAGRYEQHERLRKVAAELFATHGYSAIGLRELARHLNMQAGSLYHHFHNKQELLFELIESALSDLLNATRQRLRRCRTSGERLLVFMEVFVAFRTSDAPRLELVGRECLYLSDEQKAEVDGLKSAYVALLQSILEPCQTQTDSVLATLVVAMLFNGWGWQGVPLHGLSVRLVQLVQGMLCGQRPGVAGLRGSDAQHPVVA